MCECMELTSTKMGIAHLVGVSFVVVMQAFHNILQTIYSILTKNQFRQIGIPFWSLYRFAVELF